MSKKITREELDEIRNTALDFAVSGRSFEEIQGHILTGIFFELMYMNDSMEAVINFSGGFTVPVGGTSAED